MINKKKKKKNYVEITAKETILNKDYINEEEKHI